MICPLCRGSGNLFCLYEGKPVWFTCQWCGGAGVLFLGVTSIPKGKRID